MKKRILYFYDKMVITIILGILAFLGCSRKNYPEKPIDASEKTVQDKNDTIGPCDTVMMPKKPHDRVIALYGVRPTRFDK